MLGIKQGDYDNFKYTWDCTFLFWVVRIHDASESSWVYNAHVWASAAHFILPTVHCNNSFYLLGVHFAFFSTSSSLKKYKETHVELWLKHFNISRNYHLVSSFKSCLPGSHQQELLKSVIACYGVTLYSRWHQYDVARKWLSTIFWAGHWEFDPPTPKLVYRWHILDYFAGREGSEDSKVWGRTKKTRKDVWQGSMIWNPQRINKNTMFEKRGTSTYQSFH